MIAAQEAGGVRLERQYLPTKYSPIVTTAATNIRVPSTLSVFKNIRIPSSRTARPRIP